MAYVIVNDKLDPPMYWHHGATSSFGPECQTPDVDKAKRFATIKEAIAPLHGRADLYGLGWRTIPVK